MPVSCDGYRRATIAFRPSRRFARPVASAVLPAHWNKVWAHEVLPFNQYVDWSSFGPGLFPPPSLVGATQW
ncbi:MAG: hypothetical protein WBM17_10090, partial [Anaerolineales bacterium]